MKILIVSVDNSKVRKIGGKHIHQELLERGFTELGHDVDIAYPSAKKHNIVYRIMNKVRRVLGLKQSHQAYIEFLRLTSNRLLKEIKILKNSSKSWDCIIMQDPIAVSAANRLFPVSSEARPIFIETLHGYFHREAINYGYYSSDGEKFVCEKVMEYEKIAFNSCDVIVTVDSQIRKYVTELGFFRGQLETIYNAIDDSNFFPVEEMVLKSIRTELKLPQDKAIVLIPRRLVLKNGVIFALQAAKLYRDKYGSNVSFLLAGDGPEKKNLQNYVNENDLSHVVTFLGLVEHDKIDSYYKACDVLLVPSTSSDGVEEATSLSMLEGLICKKLVIVSNIGGMKEIVKHDENGILVEDKDSLAMAEAIHILHSDKERYERVANCGHVYCKHNHGYKEHAKKFLKVIDDFKVNA